MMGFEQIGTNPANRAETAYRQLEGKWPTF